MNMILYIPQGRAMPKTLEDAFTHKDLKLHITYGGFVPRIGYDAYRWLPDGKLARVV